MTRMEFAENIVDNIYHEHLLTIAQRIIVLQTSYADVRSVTSRWS